VLVGDEAKIKAHLPAGSLTSPAVSILHASEVIGMTEHVEAVRVKKDASVVVAAGLVKSARPTQWSAWATPRRRWPLRRSSSAAFRGSTDPR